MEQRQGEGVAVAKGEWITLLLCASAFFFVIGSFFVFRPLRDAIAPSSTEIPTLLVTVFFVMLVATPLFGLVAAKVPRRAVASFTLLFFASHLLGFFIALSAGVSLERVAALFFVWVGVFNLFVVAVFWVVMADIFRPDQAVRLFAGISLGGTLGGVVLPLVASAWAKTIGIEGVFLLSCGQVLLALFFIDAARSSTPHAGAHGAAHVPIGREALSGIVNIVKSKYLVTIVLWVLLAHILQTLLYLQQQELLQREFAIKEERFALLAQVDAGTNALAAGIQLLIAAPFLRRFGAGWSLAGACIVATVGFLAASVSSTLFVVIAAQLAFRATYFGMSLPVRHMLFSVVSTDEKFKSQSFIDTVVQRGSDAAGGWIFNALFRDQKMDLSTIAGFAAALGAAWALLGYVLGGALERRKQARLSDLLERERRHQP